ncbi:MAG TPA: AraC family transcriptional regulator, partial [Vicinamibacterales bacterium]
AQRHGIDLTAPARLRSHEATRLGRVLREECERPDSFSALACESAAWECLALIGRARSRAQPSRALERAVEFLHANLGDAIGLEQIARAAGLHPATLSRWFRRTYGESVAGHLRRLRVGRAATLLRESRAPIAEIALECGFSSQAHLTSLMRRVLGTTPGRLRAARGG